MLSRKYKHLIRTVVFIALTFFIIPAVIPLIAKIFSPGGLTLPRIAFLNTGVFGALAFFLVIIKNWSKLEKARGPELWEIIGFGCLTLVGLIFFMVLQWSRFEMFQHLLYAWGTYGIAIVFFAIAILGLDLLKLLWRDIAIVFSALIGYVGITIILENFMPLVDLTAKLSYYVLRIFLNANYVPRVFVSDGVPLIRVEKFSATFGPVCSGLFSIVLFTAIFSLVWWLDKEKIKPSKMIKFYFPGVLIAYALNILRVVAIYVIGALWSPAFALGTFHVHAGWVIFTAYSLLYWYMIYPRILKPEYRRKKKK